jgi:hypothetical protein
MESSSSSARPTVRRSKAWIYYAVLSTIALVAIPSTGWQALPAAALCGLYSAYLFRGGRIVIWFW